MKRGVALLAAWPLAACGGLPALTPAAPPAQAELAARCDTLFPDTPWVATHVLEATLPGNQQGSFLAVVAAEAPGKFRSILVSVEGLALYDASFSYGRTVVTRAVPPFDRPGFAQNMSADIQLLLFEPREPLREVGVTSQGFGACRWQRADGKTVEATLEGPERTRLRLYAKEGSQVEREALLRGPLQRGLATDMTLVAPGTMGYSLHLELVDGGPVLD